MLNSKIPVRAPSKLPVRCDQKNEVRSTIVQQKGKMVTKKLTSETKQSYQTSKDLKSNPLCGNAQNKNLQHKIKEKNLKQGRKEIPQHILKEHNDNKKPVLLNKNEKPKVVKENYASSLKSGGKKTSVSTNTHQTNQNLNAKARYQKKNQISILTKNLESVKNVESEKDQQKFQSPKLKAVTENNPVSSLKIGNKKPLDSINIQLRQNLVLRDQKKIQCPDFTTNHPSQPDIEFVPDENSRKRILSGRELSPGILKMPPRMQSSIYRKFSIYKPIAVPVDPQQAVLKFLKNRENGKRLSVKQADYQASPLSVRYSISQKTPREAVENALRRLSERRLKEKLKSAKKVTFKLPDSEAKPTTSAVKENLQLLESKRESCQKQLTYISDKRNLSQHSTPELDVNIAFYSNILSNGSQITVSDEGKTPTITSFEKIKARIYHQDSALDLPNTQKTDKIPSSILKTNYIAAATDGMERLGSFFSSNVPNPRKLRRSISASELSRTPLERVCQLDNALDLPNTRKTDKMPSSILKTNNIVAAIDDSERRGSFFCSNVFSTRKLRRSISASELSRTSLERIHHPNTALDLPNTKRTNKMPSSSLKLNNIAAIDDVNRRGSLFYSQVLNHGKLGISLNASELIRTPVERIHHLNSALNLPNTRNMPSRTLKMNNIVAGTDVIERRGSLFCSKVLNPRKLRRSLSASEIGRTPHSTSAQSQLSDAKFCIYTEKDNKVESCSSVPPFLSTNIIRTSISSPELREISEVRLENSTSPMSFDFCCANQLGIFSQMQNPLLYSQNKSLHRPSNMLMSTVKAAELRGSLYLPANKNVIESNNSQATSKLCTPCPVSFYQKSREADSFSPEFLCRRTSNIISHAPIKTPLVMRNLAEREQIDYDLSPVRQKLDFGVQKEKDLKVINQAYLQTFKTYQVIMDSLADQECCIISSRMGTPSIYSRSLSNPIAKTLICGDEMHFVPVKLL